MVYSAEAGKIKCELCDEGEGINNIIVEQYNLIFADFQIFLGCALIYKASIIIVLQVTKHTFNSFSNHILNGKRKRRYQHILGTYCIALQTYEIAMNIIITTAIVQVNTNHEVMG